MKNVIYGLRPVIESIKSGKEIDRLLVQNGLRGELYGELRQELKDKDILVQYVPVHKLNRITSKNHQGVIAYVSLIQYQPVDTVLPNLFEKGKDPFVLILDRITDVRNFGAIIRTAECAGVDLVIVPARGAAQINADAIKTSAGALNTLPVHRSMDLKKTIKFLKDSGLSIVSCTEKGQKEYYAIDYKIPMAIIMGSEEDGVSQEYLKLSDFQVKIPVKGEIASLNVSVATGIILYEVVRQR